MIHRTRLADGDSVFPELFLVHFVDPRRLLLVFDLVGSVLAAGHADLERMLGTAAAAERQIPRGLRPGVEVLMERPLGRREQTVFLPVDAARLHSVLPQERVA